MINSALRLVLFFFSGRRRHTRWPRDWSSDVCSSDLPTALILGNEKDGVSVRAASLADGHVIIPMLGMVQSLNISVAARSEERRVGKECRSRWWPYRERKKTKD